MGLLTGAHRLIAENDDLVASICGEDLVSEVRLGVPPDIVGALVPPVLRQFRERHPDVPVTLVSAGTNELRQMLTNGTVEIIVATETEAADSVLLADELVWVGAKSGIAGMQRPLPVALGPDGCAFRASAVKALTRAGLEWRLTCHEGSLEPALAALQADTAVGVFLSQTIPDRLERVSKSALLLKLPACHVNLVLPAAARPIVKQLASCFHEQAPHQY